MTKKLMSLLSLSVGIGSVIKYETAFELFPQISSLGSSREIGMHQSLSRCMRDSNDAYRSFNPEFWPDPAGMAAKVKELTGAEMMVSLWPSVEDLSVNYVPMQEQGLLATTRDGPGVQDSFAGVYTRLVDSTNPAAREFLCEFMMGFVLSAD